MSAFPVSPEKENQLAQRMVALGVREADIEETLRAASEAVKTL